VQSDSGTEVVAKNEALFYGRVPYVPQSEGAPGLLVQLRGY